MGGLSLYKRMALLFLAGKFVTKEDIGISYDAVSKGYEQRFLSAMHGYNDEMLESLCKLLRGGEDLRILDLAAGTGYNSAAILKRFPRARMTLVDISPGMLAEAEKNVSDKASLIAADMLEYLKACEDRAFDAVVCCWAVKYQSPLKIVRQCRRVLKPGGILAVLVNKKDTLPQVESVYPVLLRKHGDKVRKLMLPLPNPKNMAAFDRWFYNNSFHKIAGKEGFHDFSFETEKELAEFVTSTGALAGFDVMLDLKHPEIRADFVRLLCEHKLTKATHTYVWGIYQNAGRGAGPKE